jgi:ribosomal protein S12 methylthiotransferase accessory factor
LNDEQLADLLERLEESQLDLYMDIVTLIGIEFDDNTPWGQLTILELKLLINLALEQHEEALEGIETFLQFNTNTVERGLFYRAVQAVLEITLDEELQLEHFLHNLERMYGKEILEAAVGSVSGAVRFYGLTPTNMQLKGLDRHLRLIDSYKKLHVARTAASTSH